MGKGSLTFDWNESPLKTKCQELVGSALESMSESVESAERYLTHNEPKYRMVACYVLLYYWKASPSSFLAKWCEAAIDDEPDQDVRSCALSALGEIYSGRADARIGQIIAATVHDESQNQRIRFAAYRALFRLRDRVFLMGREQLEMLKTSSLQNADWGFVDSFL